MCITFTLTERIRSVTQHQRKFAVYGQKLESEMSLILEIPDEVVQAMRMPESEQRRQLFIELAVALYSRGILSFGKACELTSLNRVEFGLLLGRRGIPRHYTDQDLEEDVAYVSSKQHFSDMESRKS